MTMCRRFLSGLARLSICLALALVAVTGQVATASTASAQTDVKVFVFFGKGSGTFKSNQPVAISADPAPPGMIFSRWLIIGGAAADPAKADTTLTINTNGSVVYAIAQRITAPNPEATYPLTVYYGTGSGSYRAGTVVDVSAPAVRGVLTFSNWVDPLGILADPKAAVTKATIPLGRSYIFPSYVYAPPANTDVDVKVADGTVNNAATAKLKPGATATLAARVPADMEFDRWTSSVPVTFANVNASTTTFTVPTVSVDIKANFKPATAGTIDVSVTGGRIVLAGTRPVNAAAGKFKENDVLTIEANAPAAGKVFDTWTGATAGIPAADLTKSRALLTVGKTAVAVAASYKDAPVADVRVTVVSGVVVNPVATGLYKPGSQIAIRANVVAGQDFDRWTSNPAGAVFSNANARETMLTVPNATVVVTATYKAAVPIGDAVAITSHQPNDAIAYQGETIVGTAKSPTTVDTLEATISTNGRKALLETDKVTGRFALRLFEGEVGDGQAVTLTFARKDRSGTTETASIVLNGSAKPSTMQMIAGRLTFGATPALLNQLKTVGFNTWVEQQLNPNAINDAAFIATNPDSLLRLTVSEPHQLREEIPMWQMAYAAYSQRQLLEVMTFFWNNHFWSNHTDAADVDVGDIEEIRGFRRNAFGRFRDLLGVSAKSVSMMAYLDNIFSDANGINQNYARELFELHTVGVNGGYTVDDINGAARAFSGWGIRKTSADGEKPVNYVFEFNPQRHFIKEDRVISYLGLTFPRKTTAVAADITEGEQILDRLAMMPQTQEFICTKLVDLLVSDARPRSLIDKCKTAWQSSGGVIAQSLRAILLDPSYPQSVAYIRTKAKTPFEAMTASLRNLGVYPVAGKERDFYNRARQIVRDAGMDMVEFGIPTGFKEAGSAWTNTASFIQKFRGMTFNAESTYAARNSNRQGNTNYTQMMRDASMTTSEAAAAYLLALTAADRFRKDEFDLVVGALKGAAGQPGFDINSPEAENRLRKAAGLLVTLPSVQLQ